MDDALYNARTKHSKQIFSQSFCTTCCADKYSKDRRAYSYKGKPSNAKIVSEAQIPQPLIDVGRRVHWQRAWQHVSDGAAVTVVLLLMLMMRKLN